VSVHKSICA